ncbi:T9SS type B sorting domain-containing protein [Aequorivita lipolytica]|uniref:T9SS type B sorting domain-containing protein n=1 Tax=Aequorivita lipolytica TaxID=153267 RepID=A0A5C6YUG9_9FLAO|nr:T9SS type B sorting domain-containing protein [Aequorivita lipolytica]TXD70677.1 T9SS type B sorting domain-containing protein [Aequorivita lipolytica]SRX49713.1 hypothetical protein AEQU2_00176 [Aequorivita lipolytica]
MKKLILLLTLAFPFFGFGQNPNDIAEFIQFNGRYDFLAFGNTLSTAENNGGNNPCVLLPQSDADLFLGIGENVVAAYLYWGSVGTGDFNVMLNGTAVNADETFDHIFNAQPYFAARADVTNLIAAAGNGTYTFSGMDIPQATLNNYCGSTNFGGWAVYVIYDNPGGELNQIKIFDGLQSVSANNTQLNIRLDGIDVSSDLLSKIAFLAWEGDLVPFPGRRESLELTTIFGTYSPFNAINPATNNFNSTNSWSIPQSTTNYQMDLDFYDLVGINPPIIQQGVEYIDVVLISEQDYIMVNNIVTGVNSELPDATMEIDDLGILCQNGDIDIEYTVYNVNSTNELPPNTPIAFYTEVGGVRNPLGQAATVNEIAIGGSESGTVRLNLPVGTPNIFNLIAVVDDIGTNNQPPDGIVLETDETNNESPIYPVDLNQQLLIIDPGPACMGSPVILDSGLTAPFTFKWFEAGDPVNPISINPTLVVTANGTYYVIVKDGSCDATSNSVVITFRPQAVANPAPDLRQCDFGTTNGVFDLTENDDDILGAQDPALFTIKYYETEALAIAGVPGTEILGGIKFIDLPSPERIWARIEDSASGTCFDITDFDIYFSRAIAGEVNDRSFCDFDNNAGEFVDLEVEFNVEVLDGQPSSDYTITYHSSQADADNDTGALPIPYFVNAPGPETIFVRLENNDDPTTCFDTLQSFTISIDAPPTINTSPPNLILCDGNNDGFEFFDLTLQTDVITLGDPSLTVTYHGTLINAENDDFELPNPFENNNRYLDFPVTDPLDAAYGTGGVWARVSQGGSSCVSIVPFALEVRFSPVGITPEPLRVCDEAVADGIARFDLTVVRDEVLGTLDPLGFDLYYFEDFSQAVLAGQLAITPTPDFSQAIQVPTQHLNTASPYFQDIFILIVSNTNGTIPPNPNNAEGCYDIVTLNLIVDPLPEDFGPFEMFLCDDELQGSTLTDGISTFDLTSINPDVTNNDPTITVEWFLTLADEIANIPIPNPTTFQNTTDTPQTIFGRVTSEFDCKILVRLTLNVVPNPNPNFNPEPLELCDNGPDGDDGIASGWDLTLADSDIIFNELNIIVTYYDTEPKAIAGVPGTEIVMPYTNTVPFNQTVFARVEKEVPPAALGCFTIVELELIVIALPDKPLTSPFTPPFQNPFIGCDENGNGSGSFDLTLQNDGVIGIQDIANFAPITYYDTSLADAEAGIPGTEIADPTNYPASGGETIWVRLESLVTGCVRVTEFTLELELFPAIGVGEDLTECDDLTATSTDTDGLAVFDLRPNTTRIQMGNINLDVFYYATPIDQINNNPITNIAAYRNIVPFQQRIYVTVFSENGCRATNFFFINVEATPDAFSPGVMIACDADNDGFALFDLSTQTDFISGGDGNLTVTYHKTLLLAQNSIPLPLIYENDERYNDVPITDPTDARYGTGGVWVRIVDVTSNNLCPRILSFALKVQSSPVATVPAPLHECDDDPEDGVTTFNLTEVEAEVLGTLDPNGYDLYYYVNLADAQLAGDLAITPTPDFSLAEANPGAFRNTTNPQTIYILVVGNENSVLPPNPNGGEGCYDIVELQLIVDPIPGNNGPLTMDKCDDEVADRFTIFDLTVNNFTITGGDPNLTVAWFDSLGNPILDPVNYTNINTPETVVGIVSSQFGCSNSVLVTLTVLPNPTPKMNPEPIVLCDDDDDGILDIFDLTIRDTEILNGEDNVSIAYYETEQQAIDAVPGTEIIGLYQNTTPYTQIVYARVTNDVPPELLPCYTIVELQLIVVPLPDAPDSTFEDLFACDEDGDGDAIFDLTVQNNAVFGIQDPDNFEPITYYISLADAEGETNAIDPANAFESISRTVWVRLESLATGCARITPFQIVVGTFPGTGNAEDLVLCDDEVNGSTNDDEISTFNLTENTPRITGGDATLTVIYYASEQNQIDDIPIVNPGAYKNEVSPEQTIFVTVLGQNTCRASLTFKIIVNPNPEPVQPTPLFACDVDNNGFTSFDLDSKTAEIQGSDPTLLITYHESLQDAKNGFAALTSPYENIFAFNQTIFVRAAYNNPPGGTGCYTIVTLELIVNPTPVVPSDLPDLIACDDSGFSEFNLTDQQDLIFGSQSTDDYTLTYHLSQAAAIDGTPFIAQPEAYTNTSNPQTIWVRLDDNATECFKIGQFNLVVNNGLPIIDPSPLELCDDLGEINDGITTFDLTQKNSEITNGVLTQGVSYFITEQDAQDNTNRIDPDTAYVNVDANGNPINPQVLFVRVEDSNSECISFTTLTIRVISNPNPTPPTPIELCDVTLIVPPGPYDEVEIFDLTSRNAQILNGNNWTLDYYESYNEAVNELAPIPAADITAYQNKTNPQIIYVRTTNPTSLCFEIVELELIVNPLPDDTAIVSPYIVCAPDDSEIGVFNLETKVEEILGGQSQLLFEVSFYLRPIDAENGTFAIVNTTNYQNKDANNNPINPQTIYTNIRNIETGCDIGGIQSFDLIVQKGAIAVAPAEPFIICDNLAPTDGFAEFDLDDVTNQQVSDLRAEILAGQDPAIYGITFHETLEEAEAGIEEIIFPYVNIINPQRIYVRVTNNNNTNLPRCYAVVDMVIKAEQLPEISLDGEYRLCVDENGNPIAEEEGSDSPPLIDTGLDPSLYTFLWDLDGVIIVGATGPSIIALQGGVYTVTYTELSSNCEGSASATVIVSSPPFTYEANLLNGAFAGNHIIEVIATGNGTYQYQLDNGPFQDSNIFENVEPGNHTITIKDIYGCGTVTFDVGVIDYPPYFTPNGDGYHDTWNIIGIAAGDPTAKIYIFDRYGKLIKQISPLSSGWDGTYSGSPLPSSDYWFRVEYTEDGNAKEFKGHFTLKR